MKHLFVQFLANLFLISCNSIKYVKNPNSKEYEKFINEFEHKNTFVSSELWKDGYCVYKPCDLFNQKYISFFDDKLLVKIGEEVYTIKSLESEGDTKIYKLASKYKNHSLNIKKIKNEYLFYFFNENNEFYLLTTPLEQIKNYPLIINNCKEKREELQFNLIKFE